MRSCPRIVGPGRNQYSAEFGVGPPINGLTYPVFQYCDSSLPVTVQYTVVTVAMPAAAAAAAMEEARDYAM